jgi:2-polyprenyl-3-methyl-5-hydroxy-6-metoxy-1,4-benzoquinol methylase
MDISKLYNLSSLPEVDYILGLEIIEHMPNTEEFIFKIQNKSKKGLIFSFPNTGYYSHRLRLLFGRFPLQWIVRPGEHLRFWTVKDVKWWVKNLGFNLEKLIFYEGVPILNKVFPNLFSQGIIIKISSKNNKK